MIGFVVGWSGARLRGIERDVVEKRRVRSGLRSLVARSNAAAPVLLPEADAAFAEALKTVGDDGGKKKVTLLGSTGSIGTQTLDIVQGAPDSFEVSALAAGSNVDYLVVQAQKI